MINASTGSILPGRTLDKPMKVSTLILERLASARERKGNNWDVSVSAGGIRDVLFPVTSGGDKTGLAGIYYSFILAALHTDTTRHNSAQPF